MFLIFLSSLVVVRLNAHSWVRCTDYGAAITGNDYDEGQCSGWIRDWAFDGITFAQDRGINYQVGVGTGGSICSAQPMDGNSGNQYSSDYANSAKLSQYTSGSTVRVVWPAKNHANYECFNFIPDNSMKLFYNPNPDPSSDLPNDQGSMVANGWVLVKDWQEGCEAGSDGCGFQNCPKFCDGTDAATCFGDFVVPSVSTSGYYTFVWYWIFNGGTSPYISCWEAYIDAVGEATTPEGESAGDPNAGKTLDGYLTQVPICVNGMTYISMKGWSDVQFQDVATTDEIFIVDVQEGSNDFNFTVQISHQNSQVQPITSLANDQYCEEFVKFASPENPGVTCEVCDDIVTFAIYESAVGQVKTKLFLAVLSCFLLYMQ